MHKLTKIVTSDKLSVGCVGQMTVKSDRASVKAYHLWV